VSRRRSTRKRAVPSDGCAIHIGPDKLGIQAAAAAIVQILSIPGVGDQPMAEAMITLRTIATATPQNTSITGCVFKWGGGK
jgi:hypothetical protein